VGRRKANVPRGGRRPGAGRKKGSATRKTKELADRAAREGITPLELMLQAMRLHYQKGEWDAAAAIAKVVGPYVHPRLGSLTVNGEEERPIRLVEEIVIGEADSQATTPEAPRPG